MSATIETHTIPTDDRPRAKRLLRAINPRPTGFTPAKPYVIEHVLSLDPLPYRQVFVCGPAPFTIPPFVGSWELENVYNEAGRTPVHAYTHRGNGRKVDILRSEQWFGDATSSECEAAWELLNTIVGQTFPGGATLLTSPGATGRDLWQRTIPKGVEFASPPEHIADLIRQHSGQGRIEMTPTDPNIADLYELDGRLMYIGLMRELPGNAVEHRINRGRGTEDMIGSLYDRARYLISATVPIDWTHVGLVGVKDHRGRWRYPSFPGERFTTWVDGVELALISKWWGLHSVDIHQRILFDRARPLDNFARAILRMLDQLDDPFHPNTIGRGANVRRAAISGVRAIALHMLGALVGKPRAVTNRQPLTDGRPTTGEQHRIVGDEWEWTTHEPARLPHLTQPHMPAAVWARARVRLLDGPQRTGALHLARHEVVGFRTDAIYTTCAPDWYDDGTPGRYRIKRHSPGPMLTPTTQTELTTQLEGAF